MATIEGLSRAENRAQLRVYADELIRNGASVAVGGGALGIETLELLYRRASNPEFAADALKLLHELQTHQVELDLLLEQNQASENELTEELAYYKTLYQLAPIAYLVVSRDGQVTEANQTAAIQLGFGPGYPTGQTLAQYLSPPSRTAVAKMIKALQAPGSAASCPAQLTDCPDRQFSINASLSPSGDTVLMTISPNLLPVSGADAAPS